MVEFLHYFHLALHRLTTIRLHKLLFVVDLYCNLLIQLLVKT